VVKPVLAVILLSSILSNLNIVSGFQSYPSNRCYQNRDLFTEKKSSFLTNNSQRSNRKLYVTPSAVAEVVASTATEAVSTSSSTLLSNSMASSLINIGSPIGSLFVLAFIILIHEMGHFLAARSLGMAVEEFSIGFGPRVTGFVQTLTKNDKEENIEFNLRLLPLGGYVRFPENYNRTLAFENEMKMNEYDKELKKYNEEQGIIKEEKESNFLSKLFSRKEPEVVASKATKPEKRNFFSFFARNNEPKPPQPPASTEIEYSTNPNLLQNRPWIQKALVISGGVIFNILLAFTLFFGEMTIGKNGGLPKPYYNSGALVTEQPMEYGAGYNVLKKGDVITGINGQSLTIANHYSNSEAQKSISDLISKIRATPDGEYLNLVIERYSAQNQPQFIDVSLQPKNMLDKDNNPTGPQSLGIMLAPNYIKTDLVKATSIPDAIGKSTEVVVELTKDTASSLGTFLSSIVRGNGNTASLSGPIGVIRTGSDIVKSTDVNALIFFAAAISVNLAVVNSLPFPGLDGGQMVFILAEAVAGKKIDQKLQEEINGYALFVLLLLSLSTTVGDIGRLF